jgi:hypothetical protein
VVGVRELALRSDGLRNPTTRVLQSTQAVRPPKQTQAKRLIKNVTPSIQVRLTCEDPALLMHASIVMWTLRHLSPFSMARRGTNDKDR